MVCVAIEETWNGLGKGKGKKARSLRSLARLEVRRSGWPGLGEGLGKDRELVIQAWAGSRRGWAPAEARQRPWDGIVVVRRSGRR